MLDIEAQERAAEEAAAARWRREREAVAATDAELESRRAQDREQVLTSLRSVHEAAEAQAAAKVAALEEAAEAERRRAQAATDAARRQKEEAAAAAEAATAAADAAAKKKAADEEAAAVVAAAAAAAAPAQALSKHGIRSAAPSAVAFADSCAAALEAARAATRPFAEDRGMRDVKRSIDKFVTLNVQQISATLEQVRAKATALVGFISRHAEPQRTYALLALAGKLLSQCEVQITRLHAFAFPLAEVAVAVGAAHPDFVPLLLARLQDACPLAVPAYWGFRPGGDDLEYLRLARYKVTVDDDAGGAITTESTDEYVGRMAGCVMLYAAVTQSDNPANPHGLAHAWEYLARLLNGVPANRVTAAALDAFLKVAGYKLAGTYRSQFAKLLAAVERDFLGELGAAADPDVRAVATRLTTYLRTRGYATPPEGRTMPQYDASSYDRA